LHADELVVMAQGQVTHQGPCADAATHRALEAVFEHRIGIHALQGQWVALPQTPAGLSPANDSSTRVGDNAFPKESPHAH
jgi:ABC-type hemin transport system ATPase subunit